MVSMITDRKSQVADRPMSVSMTRKAAHDGSVLWWISIITVVQFDLSMIEFGMVPVTRVGSSVFLGGEPRPRPKEERLQHPQHFWDPYLHPNGLT